MWFVNLGETAIDRTIQIENSDPVVFSICPRVCAVGECLCKEEQRTCGTSVSRPNIGLRVLDIGWCCIDGFMAAGH